MSNVKIEAKIMAVGMASIIPQRLKVIAGVLYIKKRRQ